MKVDNPPALEVSLHLARRVGEWARKSGADEFIATGCERVVFRALIDTRTLDALAGEQSRQGGYFNDCRAMVENGGQSWVEAWKVARIDLDKKAVRGVLKADAGSPEHEASLLAFAFREKVLDGFTPQQALQFFADRINQAAQEGSAAAFLRLGDAVRGFMQNPDSRERHIAAWILRAWLPLSLWECNAADAQTRVKEGCDIQTAAGAVMPEFPSEKQFDVHFRRLKSRLATGKK